MKEGEEEEGEAHGNANVELTCIFGYSTLYQKCFYVLLSTNTCQIAIRF